MVAVASKRILVFCDSTGQDGLIVPDGFAEGVQPDVVFQHGVQAAMAINGCGKLKNSSNVWRLSRAVRPWSRDGKQQIVLYQGGVGSEVDFSDTYVAGTTVLQALGEAVANKIRDAYNFIAQNFQEGDEILLFGFSKGAYVARKLASLIDRIGLLVPERLDLFVRIWKEIVTGKCPTIPPGTSVARIRCVGLWDTVGSVFQDIDALRLDDTGVPSTVDVALQALSIQENREHFRPILWTVPRYGLGRNQVLTQVWFPGAHGDVGGSYSDSQISDITLFWMTSEITRRGLLDLNTDFVKQSRKSTVTSWAVSQPHNAYMETPASRRQGVRAKNRYESDYINPDSVFHQSWRHSPTVLDNPSYMITQNTLQDAYGRDWAPTYAPLSTFEEECKEQWSDQEGVSSFVDEDVSSLIGQGSIYWTSSEDRQDILHERSIPGGVDSHGSTVYIGRASYKGGLYPGAFSQSLDGCHIPWNGNRVVLRDYEKLSGVASTTRWVRVKGSLNGSSLYGLRPVLGGHEPDMTSLYICQGFYEGGVHCGNVRDGGNRASIICGEREVSLSTYAVLVWNACRFSFRNTIGQYDDGQHWESVQTGDKYSQVVVFEQPSPVVPQIILGLNCLDVCRDESKSFLVRTNAYADRITKTQFTAHIDPCSETKLYCGGVSWLKIAPGDPDFMCGTFTCSGEVSRARVPFDWRFRSQPVVFIGLCGFEIQHDWRFAVSTPAIDALGFDMRVEQLGNTVLHNAKISWVAFPGDKKGVVTGVFSADGTGNGHIQFPSEFRHAPEVFTALTLIEVNHDNNLRIRVNTGNVTTTGMDWWITTWSGTQLWKVEVAYLALEGEE